MELQSVTTSTRGNESVNNTSTSNGSLRTRMWEESKKMWAIAAPAMLTLMSQFSLEFVTLAFAGHLNDVELAAVSLCQNVIKGFVYGVMLGMGSALETLCGQAVGAGQINMLGVYLQRSWIITLSTALLLTPLYIFTTPILKLLHQEKHISEVAGNYALKVIPQIFAFALNFPIQKFLQSQSKVWVMTMISIFVLCNHVLLNWVIVVKFSHGLLGVAMVANLSWFLLIFGQSIYIMCGFFPASWTGFSFLAFKSLKDFIKLTLASSTMLWLELWYFLIINLMVGWLTNPEVAVGAVSICMNFNVWGLMVVLGFNAATSVRLSNELGAGRPKIAKFAVGVSSLTSTTIGIILAVMVLVLKDQYPKLFSDKPAVISMASKLSYFLAPAVFLSSVQTVLQGVAIGSGWQSLVAILNSFCYYLVGLPVGAVLGYKFSLGVHGIWTGLLAGLGLQTGILFIIVCRTNWNKEALQAKQRMIVWGDSNGSQSTGNCNG